VSQTLLNADDIILIESRSAFYTPEGRDVLLYTKRATCHNPVYGRFVHEATQAGAHQTLDRATIGGRNKGHRNLERTTVERVAGLQSHAEIESRTAVAAKPLGGPHETFSKALGAPSYDCPRLHQLLSQEQA